MMHVKTYFILYGEGFLLLPNYYHKKTGFAFTGKQDHDRKILVSRIERLVLDFYISQDSL